LKATSDHDIHIGGPELAGYAFRAGLIDEIQLFIIPIVGGGGKPAFTDDMKVRLELLEERCFPNGTVFLRYRIGQN
jgi:dihydrofolate reductase